MNSRRGFLWALGMGGVSLGLPNVARAFGRRRRHAPVADCECDCAREGTPRMMAQGPGEPEFYSICAIVCPQSLYASMNGVYYYTGQCCNPMGPRNVSSTLFIDCPQSCSNQANCINTAGSIIMSAHGLRALDVPNPDELLLSAGLRCEGVSYLDEPNNPNATLVIRDKTHVTQTGDAMVEYTDTKGKLRWAHICEVTRKGDTGAVVGVVRFGHPLKKKPTIVAAMLPQAEHPNPFHHRVKYMSKTFHVHVREDDK